MRLICHRETSESKPKTTTDLEGKTGLELGRKVFRRRKKKIDGSFQDSEVDRDLILVQTDVGR